LSAIHSRFFTPITTIALTCLVIALVIAFLDVERIAKLASAFTVTMFILVNTSVIVLRETAVQWYNPPYRAPLYPWVQIFGIFSGLVLLFFLGLMAFLVVIIVALFGTFLFYIYGRTRAQRSGVLKLYGHRPALFLLYRRKHGVKGSRVGKWLPEQIQESNLDGSLSGDAKVVVPLLGKERSAEMLVEMGAALSNDQLLQVVHLTEVPDQIMLDAFLHDDPSITSLNRRISAMAEDRKMKLDFDAAVTHDLTKTIYKISDQTHCQWLVIGWEGREMGGLFVKNPVGWLLAHINSNFALFKDKGVRYIRKILVCSRPGRFDTRFIQAADQIAQFYGAKATLLRVLPLSATSAEIKTTELESERLVQITQTPFKIEVVKSTDALKAISDASTAFDLLITGTPREFGWLDVLRGKGRDRLTESAACSVLRLTIHK